MVWFLFGGVAVLQDKIKLEIYQPLLRYRAFLAPFYPYSAQFYPSWYQGSYSIMGGSSVPLAT
jgi:hypothetical protein